MSNTASDAAHYEAFLCVPSLAFLNPRWRLTEKTEVILYPDNAVAHPQLDEPGS